MSQQQIVIIDYGSGNLRSVEKAVLKAGGSAGHKVLVTDHAEDIAAADRVILPGVGAFSACMSGLTNCTGVIEAMEHAVLVNAKPFLGICVGMQLLADLGLEYGSHNGLGWIAGKVEPIAATQNDLRIPNMGWREIACESDHPLFASLHKDWFYFAHSYHFAPENIAHRQASFEYGQTLTAGVARDNIVGVQFHPEKSQHAGLSFLRNFLTWMP